MILWGRAAGRCQYEGCSQILWRDELTKCEINSSYIAHIIADKPTGPRGDQILSEKFKAEISNLMLLCDAHHRLIDCEDVEGHSVETLREMKARHERQVELATEHLSNKESHVLLYGAKIGEHNSPLTFRAASAAMFPDFYPAQGFPLQLSLSNYAPEDHTPEFWEVQDRNLIDTFRREVETYKREHLVRHFSIFALAPQPLLIRLGTLLSNLYMAEVYEYHKEPATWKWQKDNSEAGYEFLSCKGHHHIIALKVEVSASINDSRITNILGNDCSIYTITHKYPRLDSLRSKGHLAEFRDATRRAFAEIKGRHGEAAEIHVFPAMSPAPAVEFGRTWMPKADLPLIIYDQNSRKGGFHKTIMITNQKE